MHIDRNRPLQGIVVGMGGISRTMLRGLAPFDWYSTCAVVDVQEEALARAQETMALPDHALFTSLDDALDQAEADVVLINTPSELHYAQVKAALEAGCHVLVAKPITNNFEEAVELVEMAATRQLTLCVGQQLRFNRHYTALRRFLATGTLGGVEMVNFLSAKPRHRALNLKGMDQPVLYEMSCHHFDSLLSLFPDHVPESIVCDGFRPSWSVYDGPCSVNAMIRFSDDLHLLYHAGFSSQADLYELRMEGASGALRCRGIHMSNDSMGYEFAARGRPFEPLALDEDMDPIKPWDPFFRQWRAYLVDGHLEDGESPPFSGRNNLKVFAMLSASIESVERRMPVAVAGNPRYAAAFS